MPQPSPRPTERWLTIQEFCALYRIGKWRFRKYRDAGQIKTVSMQIPTARGSKRSVRVLDPGWPLIDEAAKTGNPTEDVAILNRNEVAVLLGLTPEGVSYLSKAGILKGFRVAGSHLRYSIGAVRRYMAARATGKKRPASRETSIALVQWAKQQLGTAPPPAPKPPKSLTGIREKERWAKIRAARTAGMSTSKAEAPAPDYRHPTGLAVASAPSGEPPKTS